jgi:hypothetical protein
MTKYYFNCHTKKSTKIQLGEIYDIFSPCVFIFSPLGYACSTFTDGVLGVKYGKGNQTIFFRLDTIFFVTVSAYFNWGKIIMIFFPPVSLFFPSKAMQLLFYFHRRCNGRKCGKREIKSYFPRWTQSFL